MSARGSAMLRSPSIARLADTPPVVGSDITEMYGKWAWARADYAADVFAICINEYNASCMRAPPLAVKHTNGVRCSMAWSTPRLHLSPTTDPMDPPRN